MWLSYWFDWEPALTIVHPQTFKRWRRQGWRLVLKTPVRLGRPPIPPELQALIRRMARENMTWGQQRIANEVLLKLGLSVSPRTIRKYMPSDSVGSPGKRCQSQRWSTFIRNHVKALVVSGVTAEANRRAKAALASLRQLIQSLLHWASQVTSILIKASNKLDIVCLNGSTGQTNTISLNQAEPIQLVERSPPERVLSRHSEPMSAAAILPAARGEVCPVKTVRCLWACRWPKASGVVSDMSRVSRLDSWARAA